MLFILSFIYAIMKLEEIMNQYLILGIYILVINLLGFLAMKLDKELAIKHKWRISEKALFSFALFLGAIGIWAGMYTFRHKTKHTTFVVLIPVCFILNIICVYLIITKLFPIL